MDTWLLQKTNRNMAEGIPCTGTDVAGQGRIPIGTNLAVVEESARAIRESIFHISCQYSYRGSIYDE